MGAWINDSYRIMELEVLTIVPATSDLDIDLISNGQYHLHEGATELGH